jgi:F0F1-type ATP synthase assembly protein I
VTLQERSRAVELFINRPIGLILLLIIGFILFWFVVPDKGGLLLEVLSAGMSNQDKGKGTSPDNLMATCYF